MSIHLMSRILAEADLAHNHQSVLVAYADSAEDDGSSCYPSKDRVAWKTGYSVRQVKRITRELIDMGVLKVVREGTKGRNTEYKIILSKAPKKMSLPAFRALQKGGQSDTESDEWGDNMSPDAIGESGDMEGQNSVTQLRPPSSPTTVLSDVVVDERSSSPPSGGTPLGSPSGEAAKTIIGAYCNLTGVPMSTITGRDWGNAKLLSKKISADRIPALYEFAKGDIRGRHGVTPTIMYSVLTQFLAWEAEQANKPVNKSNEYNPF